MKIHALLACFILFFELNSMAQGLAIDTILPNTSFLSTVDSIEDFTQSSRSVFPALALQGGIFMDPFNVYRPLGGLIHPLNLSDQPMRFTALPLLGFAYAFGTQGSQHMKFSYAQAFNHGLLLNVHYQGHGSNGFLRNNAWKQRNYRFDLAKISRRYQTKLSLEGLVDNRQFSGGIQVDSLAGSFPLPLLPVRKDSCSATWRIQRISWYQSLNFWSDSMRFLGLQLRNSITSKRKVYGEEDTLAGLYQSIYFDSSATLDRYECVSTRNQVGIGFSKQKFSISASALAEYWRMRMAGNQHDTLELGLVGSATFTLNHWKAHAQVEKNVLGGFGASRVSVGLEGKIQNQHSFRIHALSGNIAPDVIQRFYYGNTLQYQLSSPSLQRIIQLNASIKGSLFGIDYEVQVRGMATRGVYQYNGLVWNPSVENSSKQMLEGGVCLSKTIRGFSLSPSVRYLALKNSIFPTLITGASVGFNGYITKTKNLFLFSKITYQYYNRYQPLSFDPQLSQLHLNPSGTNTYAYHNLSATVGFKVKTFRFFISGSNVGSFWMNQAQPIYDHYPIPSWQLNLGLIWEFWN
jgi:hypothetical protein